MSSQKKRGLGRGLDALLGLDADAAAGDGGASAEAGTAAGELRHLPVDVMQRGQYQPRTDMHTESLDDLAESIRQQGVVQPIVVRPLSEAGRYEIVAGERRWRAAQIAGLEEVPALVKNVPDRAAMSIALIENIQREQLNPIEEAAALARLIGEFDMTHAGVAEAVGRSRTAVSNLLRLLDLHPEAREMVQRGELDMGHARAILGLAQDAQPALARRVAAEGLSVRQTEQLVRQGSRPAPRRKAAQEPDADVAALEQRLGEQLGAAVAIRHSGSGKGSLTIRYNSLDELDGILAHIK